MSVASSKAEIPKHGHETSAVLVEKFVRDEYWRLASEGKIPYALPVCPTAPKRPDHRD